MDFTLGLLNPDPNKLFDGEFGTFKHEVPEDVLFKLKLRVFCFMAVLILGDFME